MITDPPREKPTRLMYLSGYTLVRNSARYMPVILARMCA